MKTNTFYSSFGTNNDLRNDNIRYRIHRISLSCRSLMDFFGFASDPCENSINDSTFCHIPTRGILGILLLFSVKTCTNRSFYKKMHVYYEGILYNTVFSIVQVLYIVMQHSFHTIYSFPIG